MYGFTLATQSCKRFRIVVESFNNPFATTMPKTLVIPVKQTEIHLSIVSYSKLKVINSE